MDSQHANNGTTDKPQGTALWEAFLQEGYDYERPQRGDIVKGVILELHPDAAIVDIGVKREGLVPASDLRRLDEETLEALEIGAEVSVFIERPWNASGELIVSIARGKEAEDWEEAGRLLDSGEILELPVAGYNRGGITVSLGQIRGFIPASHLRGVARNLSQEERAAALAAFVDQTLRLKVIEVDRKRRRLVLSQREAERAYRRQRKRELLQTLKIGQVLEGKVTSLRDFGAFVDIGGADGLLHVSEISHGRISHPRDALSVGQEIKTEVVRLDPERGRIGLSMRRLQPNPWDTVHQRFYPGQLVEARITNVVNFGAFAELEPGIEGLIHVSRLGDGHVSSPESVVSIDDWVMTRILHIDAQQQRIGLSLKDVPQWIEEPAEASEPAEVSESTEDSDPIEASEPAEPAAISDPEDIETSSSLDEAVAPDLERIPS